MLEDPQVEPGMRVLEIGTGTGYSTVVLATRRGDELVTSIEYDSDVATKARAVLWQQGINPTLVTGDGFLGHAESTPYDRIVATCGITVLSAWIAQTRPGGLILAAIGGWLPGSELARLTVHKDGIASSPLLGGQVRFMVARPQAPPPLGRRLDLPTGTERQTNIGAEIPDDWTARFIAQFAPSPAPRASSSLPAPPRTRRLARRRLAKPLQPHDRDG
ncbi:methyltransferase domain-containing protein [Streptomyces sp. NPDC087908]|uniref:methyltransferase domain-containing protein n=1 Tax=Streptomyces sp. NPDC087908 TaxID=3365820 RepID=UPI0037F1236B